MDNFNLVFTKQTVFVFNLLFGVTGISLFATSIIIYAEYHQYHNFIGDHSWIAPFILITVGFTVFLITILCCYGTFKGNSRMIQIFLVIFTWIFILELGTGVVVYLKKNQFNETLDNSFDLMLNNHEKNEKEWRFVQTELACCGIDSPKDWTQILNNTTIPASCCRNQTIAPANCTEENATKIGCKLVLLKHLENLSIRLAGTGFGIGWIQIVVIGYGCFLFNAFRNNYFEFSQRLL